MSEVTKKSETHTRIPSYTTLLSKQTKQVYKTIATDLLMDTTKKNKQTTTTKKQLNMNQFKKPKQRNKIL